jgi:hypothetical protein
MKKLIAVFMVAGLASFAACNNAQEQAQDAAAATEATATEAAQATEAPATEAAETMEAAADTAAAAMKEAVSGEQK